MPKPETPQPQPIPKLQLEQGGSLQVNTGKHTLKISSEREQLLFEVRQNDTPLLTAAVLPDSRVVIVPAGITRLIFEPDRKSLSAEEAGLPVPALVPAASPPLPAGQVSLPTPEPINQPAAKETKKAPEKQPITVQGTSYRSEYNSLDKTYRLRIAHHPDPSDRSKATFCNILAQGEKAREFYGLYINRSGISVHVTGQGRKLTTKKGELEYNIEAETLEKLPHGTDGPILNLGEKITWQQMQEQE